MFVCGSFAYNFHLELAIGELQKKDIPEDAIAAIMMDSRVEERKILDTIHRADGISSFDAAALLGSFCLLLGSIYGFVLNWGPIIWGLIGLLLGAVLGFVGDLFITRVLIKKRTKNKEQGTIKANQISQVFIIVECEASQAAMIKKVLWENLALGVGTLPG